MVSEGCRRHRHLPVEVQHAALTRRLVGHFNDFGVNGNHRSLARVVHATQRVWRKMAAPSQPAHASHVGAVQPIVGTLPASPAAGCRADMGGVATRHISGGAGWWKSPCPVLVRASGEQSPGATRPPNRLSLPNRRRTRRETPRPISMQGSSNAQGPLAQGYHGKFVPAWQFVSKTACIPRRRPGSLSQLQT